MTLLIILLADAAMGGLAGLVFRSSRLALHAAVGMAGAFLAGMLGGGDALLSGLNTLALGTAVCGALVLVTAARAVAGGMAPAEDAARR